MHGCPTLPCRRVAYEDGHKYEHDVNYIAMSIWDARKDYVRACGLEARRETATGSALQRRKEFPALC